MKAAAVVLAAGGSSRLGSPKQLAVLGGEALLVRAVRVCAEAGLFPVIVVLGANAEQIEAACDLSGASVFRNTAWRSGVASSIHVGIAAAEAQDVAAAVLTTCDMPFVTADHLRALVALAHAARTDAGSAADGWAGTPACFLRDSFPELLRLEGDAGARQLLQGAPTVRHVNGLDVDTPEDLAAIR